MVQLEVHAGMEPLEPEVHIEPEVPDEPLDPIREPLTPKDPIQENLWQQNLLSTMEKTVVPDLQQLSMSPPKPVKSIVPEQTLPQVLPMPRSMPLPDPVWGVPDQPVPF